MSLWNIVILIVHTRGSFETNEELNRISFWTCNLTYHEILSLIAGSLVAATTMNHQYGEDQDRVSVVGFDVPTSPEASYNNVYLGNEDEGREPPSLPPHLHHTLLNQPTTSDPCASLPSPQNVTLNHLYIENRESPRSVVAVGVTHRFRSKFVTVVLYKPVPRR